MAPREGSAERGEVGSIPAQAAAGRQTQTVSSPTRMVRAHTQHELQHTNTHTHTHTHTRPQALGQPTPTQQGYLQLM